MSPDCSMLVTTGLFRSYSRCGVDELLLDAVEPLGPDVLGGEEVAQCVVPVLLRADDVLPSPVPYAEVIQVAGGHLGAARERVLEGRCLRSCCHLAWPSFARRKTKNKKNKNLKTTTDEQSIQRATAAHAASSCLVSPC